MPCPSRAALHAAVFAFCLIALLRATSGRGRSRATSTHTAPRTRASAARYTYHRLPTHASPSSDA